MTAAAPLSHDAVLRLFVQLAVLVFATRAVAEVLRLLRQPPVVGELLAGILLGPTGLGHFAPGAFHALFPPGEPMRLVEAVSWLGMTLLMLLAGLETDVRLLRHLGRPAIAASSLGMVVPMALGATLGMLLSPDFVPPDVPRPLLAAFLATAMGISAMPVISRILLDLKLMRRNFGVLVLSAGVVDDTTGWLILSVIAGAAEGGGIQLGRVALTAAGVLVFLAIMRWVVHPLVSRAIRFIDDELSIEGSDVAFVAAFTFACAAATQALGVHAVFGAFVAGVVLRQAPRLRPEAVSRLESAALSVFSPVFFAYVGLKVDLWTLPGPGLALLFVGIATAGKLVGCYAGGRLGGMSRWESFAIGVAMNARGAMELVVATMGLSLGILDQRLFSVLVLVALVTSFAAPLVLGPLAKRLPMTREEQARIAEGHRHPLAAGAGRVVCLAEDGLAGVRALELAMTLAAAPDSSVLALHPEAPAKKRLLPTLRGGALAHLDRLAEAGKAKPGKVTLKSARDAAQALVQEASRGAALAVIASSAWPPPAVSQGGITTSKLGCSLALLHLKRGGKSQYQHLLVPTDGSAGSRLAIEIALAYAAGSGARVTVLHVMERPLANPLLPHRGLPPESARRLVEVTLEKSLAPMVSGFPESSRPHVHVQVIEASPANDAIVRETQVGPYDLLVVHSTEKAVQQRLFFGYGAEFLVGEASCSVLCLLPAEGA